MAIITLLSDFGTKDYSVSAVKAKILNALSNATIVDISHEVSPFNIVEGAFIFNSVFKQFPEKTIHLIGIDAEAKDLKKHLIVSLENQILIGADNGFFSLLEPTNKFQKIIELRHNQSVESIFPMRDVFVEIAEKIANNTPLESLGKPIKKVKEWVKTNPDFSNNNKLVVHVSYVDRFGNLITDINKKVFHQIRKNRKFEINISNLKINKIYQKYDDFVEETNSENYLRPKAGKALAVFNSLDLLEIALYKSDPNHGGSASELLGYKVGDTININFL